MESGDKGMKYDDYQNHLRAERLKWRKCEHMIGRRLEDNPPDEWPPVGEFLLGSLCVLGIFALMILILGM